MDTGRPAHKPGGEVPTEVPAAGGSFRDFVRWRRQRKRLIEAHRRRGETLPGVDPEGGRDLWGNDDSVTWSGHATVIHRLDGHTVVSDPVWSRRVGLVVRRLTPAAPAWHEVPTPEVVTISHNHYDHMDASTLRKVRKVATVAVPKGVGAWFRKRRFTHVHEFDWWETKDLHGLKVTFVPSKHFSGRTPWDRDRSLYGGWVLEGKRSKVYHAGDSGYFDGFRAIGDRWKGFDVACLPIGAYEPRWFMKPYHVDPDEAGRAFLDVRGRHLLPIHWGTFRLSDEAMDEPPRRVRAFFDAHGLDPGRLWLPDLGATVPVSRRA